MSRSADPASEGNRKPPTAPARRRASGQQPRPIRLRSAPKAPPGTQTITIIDGIERQAPGSDRSPGPAEAQHRGRGRPASARDLAPWSDPENRARRRPPGRSLCAPAQAQPGKAAGPRIAIVIGGLGIGASGTSEALGKLPGPVTFAFTPYGTDLDTLVGRARADGHEILLQVPMEPFDYPDNDPGPQTLLTSLSRRAEYRPPALAA